MPQLRGNEPILGLNINSFTDFEVVTNFCARWRKRIQVDEMKVQKRDLMKDSTQHL
jgi:hypothetical protein